MGTLLDSFQSYSATRSRSPVPEAAVSGKRDSYSVAALWLFYFFVSGNDRQNFVCLNQNPFHASTNTTFLRKVTLLLFHEDENIGGVRTCASLEKDVVEKDVVIALPGERK